MKCLSTPFAQIHTNIPLILLVTCTSKMPIPQIGIPVPRTDLILLVRVNPSPRKKYKNNYKNLRFYRCVKIMNIIKSYLNQYFTISSHLSKIMFLKSFLNFNKKNVKRVIPYCDNFLFNRLIGTYIFRIFL